MSKHLNQDCPRCGTRLTRPNRIKTAGRRGAARHSPAVWTHKRCPRWKAWEVRAAKKRAAKLRKYWLTFDDGTTQQFDGYVEVLPTPTKKQLARIERLNRGAR